MVSGCLVNDNWVTNYVIRLLVNEFWFRCPAAVLQKVRGQTVHFKWLLEEMKNQKNKVCDAVGG